MKRILISAAVLMATAITITTPARATDVGLSLTIGQPGFYGQIDIGDYPQPRTVYRNPIIIERTVYERPPIYLNVPPGHAKDWRKHCGHYNACGERVYFVNNNWYNQEYVPRYQARHRDGDGNGHHGGYGNGNGKDDHGNGNGKGDHGNDHVKDNGNNHNDDGPGRNH